MPDADQLENEFLDAFQASGLEDAMNEENFTAEESGFKVEH
jgi:hypothetical protein